MEIKDVMLTALPYGKDNMIEGIIFIILLPIIGLVIVFLKLKKKGNLKSFFTTADDD